MERDKADLIKDEVNKVIINTKNILIDFKDRIKLGQDELPKIPALRKQLENIKGELGKINSVISRICVLYEEFEGYLEEQQKELDANSIVLVDGNREQLILLIDENLPDGMGIRGIIMQVWLMLGTLA